MSSLYLAPSLCFKQGYDNDVYPEDEAKMQAVGDGRKMEESQVNSVLEKRKDIREQRRRSRTTTRKRSL